jgi:excinuclease UvrABC nuclease subunit
MEKAAKDLDFMQAAQLRDEIKRLQEQMSSWAAECLSSWEAALYEWGVFQV